MLDLEREKKLDKIQGLIKVITRGIYVLILGVVALAYFIINPPNFDSDTVQPVVVAEDSLPEYESGIHLATGFKEGENLNLVIANCTSCHSAKMVTQNRATREGWKSMIKWMQETQNLWELGENEPLILDYLAKYYAPEETGRRKPLANIDWYELED